MLDRVECCFVICCFLVLYLQSVLSLGVLLWAGGSVEGACCARQPSCWSLAVGKGALWVIEEAPESLHSIPMILVEGVQR